MKHSLKAFSVIYAFLALSQGVAATVASPFRVIGYDAEIVPNLKAKDVSGQTTIRFESVSSELNEVRFPRNGLSIESVKMGGTDVPFQADGDEIVIQVQKLKKSKQAEVLVRYHGKPDHGLVFGDQCVYSAFSTCHWMVCREEPGEKAPITIHITIPSSFKVVASGVPTGHEPAGAGKVRHTWKEERPYSSYLFGFAAGDFAEASTHIGKVELRLLGSAETPDSLEKKFQPTAGMLHFFEEKAGVSVPSSTYTQVLVPGTEAQEVSSFSVVGKEYVDPILTDPQEDWVIAHELAHQWWGNSITCKSWPHFWLNEGMTVFMVAAYKEHRWGKSAYDHELDIARKRYQKAIDAGFDVPLAYSKEFPSLQIKRAIVYSKGALFLHSLREQLGDQTFWKGIRAYTQKHAGGVVESKDFQLVMEKASGKDLSGLFKKWVYE